jgi:hypothetical protein
MDSENAKEKYQKELRRLWFRENLKGALMLIPILLLVALIMFVFYTSTIVDSTEEVVGTITGRGAWDSKFGNTAFMTVTLQDGTKIRAYFSDEIFVKKGKKAVFYASKAKFFGAIRYSFKEYVEDK